MFVCQISNNLLGQVDEVADEEEGKALVLRLVAENGVEITDAVREEVNNDLSYLSEEADWSVCIGIPS